MAIVIPVLASASAPLIPAPSWNDKPLLLYRCELIMPCKDKHIMPHRYKLIALVQPQADHASGLEAAVRFAVGRAGDNARRAQQGE
jgi:hypothetical protein